MLKSKYESNTNIEQEITNVQQSGYLNHNSSQAQLTYDITNPSWEDFEVIHILGHGSYGTIYKVRKKQSKKIFVIKEVDTSTMSKKQSFEALEEINIMGIVESLYIVKYYDSFVSDNTKINIIMEFCEHGDLHSYLKKLQGKHLNENKIWKFFIQITLGMYHLHSQNILHRDLKTLNIFLTKGNQIRIGDLGVAKILQSAENFVRSKVGTPYYLSPEVCEDRPYNNKSDIWSLGCVLYEMCCLKHPFEAKNQAELLLKIIKGKYESLPKIYSKDLADLVHSCLMKDYNKRPSVSDIILNQRTPNQTLQLSSRNTAGQTISQFNSVNISGSKDPTNQQSSNLIAKQKLLISEKQQELKKGNNTPSIDQNKRKLQGVQSTFSPMKITQKANNIANNKSRDDSLSDQEKPNKLLTKTASQKNLAAKELKFHLDLKNGNVIPEEGVTQHQLRNQFKKLNIKQIEYLQKFQLMKKNKTTQLQSYFSFKKNQLTSQISNQIPDKVISQSQLQLKRKGSNISDIQEEQKNQMTQNSQNLKTGFSSARGVRSNQLGQSQASKNPKIKPNMQTKSGGVKNMKIKNFNPTEIEKTQIDSKQSMMQSKSNYTKKKEPTKRTSEDTRKLLFEKFRQQQVKKKQDYPLNDKLNLIKTRIKNVKNQSLSQKQSSGDAQANTIKEMTHSSRSSNKFQMSGMLMKNQGEHNLENAKIEEEDDYKDELGDLLDDEELDQLLLHDFGDLNCLPSSYQDKMQSSDQLRLRRLSYLDDEKNFYQNSLFDLDLDQDNIDDTFEDPFSFTKQQILDDVLRESALIEKDSSSKRHRAIKSSDANFLGFANLSSQEKQYTMQISSQNQNETSNNQDQSMRSDRSQKFAATHQNLKEFFLSQDDNQNANNQMQSSQSESEKVLQKSLDKLIESMDNRSIDMSFEQQSIRNINFSIDGEQLKERVKEIEARIKTNKQKCLLVCLNKQKIVDECIEVVTTSLKKDEIYANDFQDIQLRITDIIQQSLHLQNEEEKKQSIVNEMLFSVFKIYYLTEERDKCLQRLIL
eukprot:403368372